MTVIRRWLDVAVLKLGYTRNVCQLLPRATTGRLTLLLLVQVTFLRCSAPSQLWLVSTDYDNWALVCTTSVSLGEGRPVQACASSLF